jgi:dipeptidyl aminopeptidase/acylaminoacyl peptidase
MRKVTFYFLFFFFFAIQCTQTVCSQSPLQLMEIMKGNAFIGHSPESIHWSADGARIYFDWNPTNDLFPKRHEFSMKNPRSGIQLADSLAYVAFDSKQPPTDEVIYEENGELYLYSKKNKEKILLYGTDQPIYDIQRVVNPKHVYFVQNDQLFLHKTDVGSIQQISHLRSGKRTSSAKDSTFLMKEEMAQFEFLQLQKNRSEWKKKHPNTPTNVEIYFGEGTLDQLQIAPSEKYVSFRLSQYPKERETVVMHDISNDGYAYTSPARAKAGAPEPAHALYFFEIGKNSLKKIDFSSLTGIREKPGFLNDTSNYSEDRKVVMHRLVFHPSRDLALCDVRAYDNKDRWIALIDFTSGKLTELDRQHDDAWIGGPGISGWNTEPGTLGWIGNTDEYFFQSEESGFSHLYTMSVWEKQKKQLTQGKWEVHDVQLSKDQQSFYITANRSHPGNRDFLKVDKATGKVDCILCSDGFHEVTLSPDESMLAVRYSYKNKPWELYYAVNKSNTSLVPITTSLSQAFNSYAWRAPEIITFSGSDNTPVYARVYHPKKEVKNGAAVLFVHGAGYLQNAHNYWSNYYREYMFHNLLCDEGFTVLDIDYRASEGYGRDYRTAIYREMGGRDLQDYLDGKQWLTNNHEIDSNRVGIYGGSYGGFITLMALLKTPGQFACGAALRSVTDWAHYNHEYTTNILNYPDNDPDAYRRSSPITYVNGLSEPLLILHGMIDDNVQFQDVVRLSQRFIELNKKDWNLAVYPVEAHGFKETDSWYDEYRRIYELFHTYLVEE